MSTHASHGVHEVHHPVIVRLRILIVEDIATLDPSSFNCLYATSSLSVKSGRTSLSVLIHCVLMPALLATSHLSHEEADLVE
ncbi:uncharacterized protein [Blastocystis hominis]|uniref:Uncharacterized protein n=1 Tax=Blastocystis hominis TaxID=12968 RepID=D8M619_BLAHO|nr:uncharacterized protein [Blastocystis hominis]CBK23618.2 unnamed protein product [Blastocystis hominis]|eukprot:XP_012897666.1 uncharacterized protein [Blastocystis hominis]